MKNIVLVVLLVLALVQTVPGADLDTKTLTFVFEEARDTLAGFSLELSSIRARPPRNDTDLATVYTSAEMIRHLDEATDAFFDAYYFLQLLDDSCNCISPACRGLAFNVGLLGTIPGMMRFQLLTIINPDLRDVVLRAVTFLDILIRNLRKFDWGPCAADVADRFRYASEVLKELGKELGID